MTCVNDTEMVVHRLFRQSEKVSGSYG